MRQLKLVCVVMAPTKSNRKPGDKVKTDKRDACKIAREFRNGDIVEVRVPPATDEAVRDVSRARTDAVDDRTRSKQRLKSFLLRNGYRYEGKANWSGPHMNYLRSLQLADPAQAIVLEEWSDWRERHRQPKAARRVRTPRGVRINTLRQSMPPASGSTG